MSTMSCSFVVWAEPRGLDETIAARARALERFYSPVGLTGLVLAPILEGRAWVGTIGAPERHGSNVSWGAPFGTHGPLDTAGLDSDESLRRDLVGVGVTIAWQDDSARIVTAASGPNPLYRAAAPGVNVWATHAVAAGYLAAGAAELDPAGIPELVAYDFVGTTRTLVKGVVPQPPATRIELTRDEVREDCYWPAAERWSALPEDDAHDHTAAALLDTLDARVHQGDAALGLTAGADSRVLAVALHELGKEASAFCWGDPGWPDVEGARRVADALGMPFSAGTSWRADAELRRILDAEARWTDGGTLLAASDREWPPGATAVVLGAAGEVGRTFYYRREARGQEPHDPDDLAELLRSERRLPGAEGAAHQTANASVAAWLDRAADSGLRGWRLLDVVYAEQRVGCWGRIQLPPLDKDIVAGFAPQQVIRGLTSLPLGERVSDGFHRRFVADRRPDLALPEAPSATADSKPPRWRQELRRVRRRRRAASASAQGDPLLLAVWGERPVTREWVAEEVLGPGLIRDALGDRWADATRAGFLAGRKRASEQAAVAAGPVALATALRDLE